jgi:hypothetical protein
MMYAVFSARRIKMAGWVATEVPIDIKTWDDLKRDVEANGGVKTYRMELLRNVAGFSKLGVHVRNQIADELLKSHAGDGKALGDYYWDLVQVYLQVGPVAKILRAARTPGEESDAVLREAAGGGSDADEVLKKIKALVC